MRNKFEPEIAYLATGLAGTNSVLLQPLAPKVKGIEDIKASVEYFFFGRSRTFFNHQNCVAFDIGYFEFLVNSADYRIHKDINGTRAVAEFSGRHELSESTNVRNKYRCMGTGHVINE